MGHTTWYENTLTVTGSACDVALFVSAHECKNVPLTFSILVPPADDTRAAKELAWGCSAEASDVDVGHNPEEVLYSFKTPGHPPKTWLLDIGRRLEALEFLLEYNDYAHGVKGELLVSEGLVIEDACQVIPEWCDDDAGDACSDDATPMEL